MMSILAHKHVIVALVAEPVPPKEGPAVVWEYARTSVGLLPVRDCAMSTVVLVAVGVRGVRAVAACCPSTRTVRVVVPVGFE
eukprot:1481028-Pyramimonas_sp.AAC.1